jgi:hypothetical protein
MTNLNGNHAIKALLFEFIVYHISSDDSQVLEAFLLGILIYVTFLCSRIRESCDLGIGEDFRKIQRR